MLDLQETGKVDTLKELFNVKSRAEAIKRCIQLVYTKSLIK